jgi:hypothetical protein
VISASSDPRLVVGAEEAHPYAARPQFKRSENASLLKSPWPWIGLGGLVVVVLVVLALSAVFSSRSVPGDHRQIKKDTVEQPSQGTHATPPAPIVEGAPVKPKDTGGAPHAAAPATDLNKLLAEARKIALTIRSNVQDQKDPLNQALLHQMQETFQELSLQPVKTGSKTAMQVGLQLRPKAGGEDMIDCSVFAELKCTTADGKTVTVWKDRLVVASAPASATRSDETIETMKAGVRKFFNKFADAVRAAREKLNPKPAG